MEQPLFTIATITYNSAKYVRQAIESILTSTFTDFEYLISDDCSTDHTWEIIQEYKDPRIRAWRNETNLGEYPNRNKVLRAAKGKYILYIDGDDILYKDSLYRIAQYIRSFPTIGAIFGVPPHPFDFIVFPFEFEPAEITKLIYLSTLPISIVGFAETIFKVESLKKIGGFSEEFMIGDTYIKKKIACYEKILLVPMGFTFWRQTSGQASKRASKRNRSMIENYFIDREVINSDAFPLSYEDKLQVLQNLNIRSIKLLIANTLFKGDFLSFQYCFRLFGFNLINFKYLFLKGKYDYTCNRDGENPLLNTYNLINSKNTDFNAN